ncbi:hypothetical protein C1645_813277 [Glomus cerebriforme]|uniref:Uncharacterized protein n=1 Tax=Glomus cerebriforme TaxID=658196 RepID=A0A397TSJ3_9GLOM|nr:hypothetical protein C1645_813277 [Glomus cerebriforme]
MGIQKRRKQKKNESEQQPVQPVEQSFDQLVETPIETSNPQPVEQIENSNLAMEQHFSPPFGTGPPSRVDNYVKPYPLEDDRERIPPGVSCFVPLSKPHNVPSERLHGPESPCYYLPPESTLPDGLALVFTNTMQLRFPSGVQEAWHFHMFPTRAMTIQEFSQMIKNINWFPCNVKANAVPDELVNGDDDIDHLKDMEIIGLYLLMVLWYDEQATDAIDRLLANEIHTWISMKTPSLQDLLCDESRSLYIFSALSRIETQSVTLETYRAIILDHLEDKFGWNECDFSDSKDCKIDKIDEPSGNESSSESVLRHKQMIL